MTDRKLNESLTSWTKLCSARTLAMTLICCPGASAQLCICGHVRGQPRGTSAKGPDRTNNLAWRAWLSALLIRRCPLTVSAADAQGKIKGANAPMKGARSEIECGKVDVLISARCEMGCDRYAM